MGKHSFYATLSANIELSDEEFELICEHAEHHYDYTVKSSVKRGGFLYGAKGSRDYAAKQDTADDLWKDYRTREYTSRNIQTMLKAIEFNQSEAALNLYKRLRNIAMEMQEKQMLINNNLIL